MHGQAAEEVIRPVALYSQVPVAKVGVFIDIRRIIAHHGADLVVEGLVEVDSQGVLQAAEDGPFEAVHGVLHGLVALAHHTQVPQIRVERLLPEMALL